MQIQRQVHNRRQLMAHPVRKPFRIPCREYHIKSEIVLLAHALYSYTIFITRILYYYYYIHFFFIVHGYSLYC